MGTSLCLLASRAFHFSFFIFSKSSNKVQINVVFQIAPKCYGITNKQSYIACRRLFSFTGTAVTGVRLSRKTKQIFNKGTKILRTLKSLQKLLLSYFLTLEIFLRLEIMFQTSDQSLLR